MLAKGRAKVLSYNSLFCRISEIPQLYFINTCNDYNNILNYVIIIKIKIGRNDCSKQRKTRTLF